MGSLHCQRETHQNDQRHDYAAGVNGLAPGKNHNTLSLMRRTPAKSLADSPLKADSTTRFGLHPLLFILAGPATTLYAFTLRIGHIYGMDSLSGRELLEGRDFRAPNLLPIRDEFFCLLSEPIE
jgi:hypothetical protein